VSYLRSKITAHPTVFTSKYSMCRHCCWTTHSSRRRHSPMAWSMKRCNSLPHSMTFCCCFLVMYVPLGPRIFSAYLTMYMANLFRNGRQWRIQGETWPPCWRPGNLNFSSLNVSYELVNLSFIISGHRKWPPFTGITGNSSSFRHSKRCKNMPKMHQNTFCVRALPGPAERALALPQTL